MPNENQGAKASRHIIKLFQMYINSPRLAPDQCYRMASSTYPLVCYVNQVTGLYLSKNYAVIPLFLRRAHEQLISVQSERVTEPYRQLVLHYLSHVAHFIVDYSCLSDDESHYANLIPQELLDIAPDPLPKDLVIPGEF